MKIRHKLFLLLLALAVVPLLILRLKNQTTLSEMGQDLVQRSENMLVSKARAHMLVLVEDHARILHWQNLLLEKTLLLQAVAVEHFLAGHMEPGSTMDEAQKQAAGHLGELALTQATVFADGRAVVSPRENALLFQDLRQTPWYQNSLKRKATVWTTPSLDQATNQIVLTLSTRLHDASGKVLGVTAIMAPMGAVLHKNGHYEAVSPRLKAYLVSLPEGSGPEDSVQTPGFHIIGQQEQAQNMPNQHDMGMGMGMGMAWHMFSGQQWLNPENQKARATMLSHLCVGESGVIQAPLNGLDSLWAFAPTGGSSALVLVAPVEDVLSDARKAGDYIQGQFEAWLRSTLYLVAGVLMVIVLAAVLASRAVSKPIGELALAAEQLGRGDFTVQVQVHSNDEIGRLALTFNQVVPHLRDRSRLLESLAMAREIQGSLLPKILPTLPGLELAGRSLYCDETGGDYFDVIENIHGLPGQTGVLLGDVTGHGLPAALLMTTARAFLRLRALQPGTPGQVVSEANQLLAMDTNGTGRFMTLFYLELDQDQDKMRWVRAGHDPAMLYDPASDSFVDLGGPGLPLGAVEDFSYRDNTRPGLEPGQILLVGSDGLWEARNKEGEMFGKDRVRDEIRANAARSAQELLEAILEAMTAFRGQQPVEDDVTLVVLRVPA